MEWWTANKTPFFRGGESWFTRSYRLLSAIFFRACQRKLVTRPRMGLATSWRMRKWVNTLRFMLNSEVELVIIAIFETQATSTHHSITCTARTISLKTASRGCSAMPVRVSPKDPDITDPDAHTSADPYRPQGSTTSSLSPSSRARHWLSSFGIIASVTAASRWHRKRITPSSLTLKRPRVMGKEVPIKSRSSTVITVFRASSARSGTRVTFSSRNTLSSLPVLATLKSPVPSTDTSISNGKVAMKSSRNHPRM
mmetsp:Transcript_53480/g.122399  ORF Transcript_53480/g.122399 Transcript_53480/m.122399 type:complete len:254 (-) Transcript_53480:1212-1973(-)